MYVENKRKYPDEEEPPTSSRGAMEPVPPFSALKSRWRVAMPKFRCKKGSMRRKSKLRQGFCRLFTVRLHRQSTVRVCCLAQNFGSEFLSYFQVSYLVANRY